MSQRFSLTSQYIDWCRTGDDAFEEDVNEVEKDQPDGEPTNLFDDPLFETNEPVHVDHQTHDKSFTYTFDTRWEMDLELACKGYNVSFS